MIVHVMIDARNGVLFENIDKIIDGTSGAYVDGAIKLVLMRKTGRKEDLVNGFDKKVGDQDEMETVAVFKEWAYWEEVQPKSQKETLDTKEELKKLGSKDLRKLDNVLRRVVSKDTRDGLYAYGLMVYVSDEMKRRQKRKFNPDIPSTGHL